jgi:hypothetical protein
MEYPPEVLNNQGQLLEYAVLDASCTRTSRVLLDAGPGSLLQSPRSEQLEHLEQVVKLTEDLTREVREDLRAWFEFSAGQARGNHEVIARFGRYPHRNESLGRQSTQDELEYLAPAEFVHDRRMQK